MFTSKKAQYLDNQFNRISPITNIDSLYYEKAEINGNNTSIYRKSFVKTMPIQFNKNFQIHNITPSLINPISNNYFQPLNVLTNDQNHIYLNTSIHAIDILNPINKDTHTQIYDTSLFKIVGEKYIDLHKLLSHYTQLSHFNASINSVKGLINNVNIDDINNRFEQLNELIYNNEQQASIINNDIYFIDYIPSGASSPFMKIKVQNISTNDICQIISLDDASALNDNTSYIKNWVFHYDTSNNKITYLKDEYGNEGSFDFINLQTINGYKVIGGMTDRNRFKNNKLYFNSNAAITIFNVDEEYIGNKIYNSSYIILGHEDNSTNYNFISNSCGIKLNGNNNTIINSSNNIDVNIGTFLFSDTSLNIDGNNNIIINCNNCVININGNNNVLINLENQNLNLNDNNIIIGDEIGCQANNKILSNDRLFFNQSTSTAIRYNLNQHCVVFGGIGNDISVYSDSYRTTNK